MTAAEEIIRPAQLIELYKIGFKLVPLDEDGKPSIAWTDIYENVNYWNPERLVQESYRFKNVATTFGKTHLEDDQGPLYLYALDIDSEEVYKILFRLQNGDGPEYGLIERMQQCSVVIKTRKAYGFHLYWLSHKQHKPILTTDCKQGFEFEIKAEKSCSTLPPSRHREDPDFQYRNTGQHKLFISDKLYDKLVEALRECLETKGNKRKKSYDNTGAQTDLDDKEIQVISSVISPYYKKPRRHPLAFALSGLFHKSNVSKDSTIALMETLAKEDSEQDRRKAIATVEETYQQDPKVVAGSKYLLETLERVTGDHDIAKDILDKIFRIISKGDVIQRLTRNIMNEYVFVTMKDNEEDYYYNGKGLYVLGGESLINELCELMCPQIKTHELNEVIGHIKRRTYVDRSKFDSNIDVLNLRNGLLDIQSKELQPHTPEYLSIVQMPTEYKPDAECPKILEFFKELLRPEEVDVMFRLIGYCLHKNCEYEKAAMLYGTGANGKGVVIRLIEELLGQDNCSHRSLQHLDTNRFAVADVCGKLVNTFADLKSVKLSETGNFKMLVSGDSISGEHKFENSFKFRNFAKLIFSANEIPESEDKSDAFYRRWLIFHFDKKFVGGKEDTKLLEKLTTPDELSGLLNKALTGLKQLVDDGGFHDKDIEDIRRDYEEHTNDVNTFLYRECLVDIANREYSALATDVYAAYVTFCVKRGSRPKEMSVFGKKLADQGIYNMRHQDHGDRDRYYDGIRLLTDMRGLNQTTIA